MNAKNLALTHFSKYNFTKIEPLSKDLWTKFVKGKGQASSRVFDIDSHHPNVILQTVPVSRGLKRRNLETFEFFNSKMDPPECLIYIPTREIIVVFDYDHLEDIAILPCPPKQCSLRTTIAHK